MVLVFSDEFNQDGRTFYPGDDPYWEAVDLHYWGTVSEPTSLFCSYLDLVYDVTRWTWSGMTPCRPLHRVATCDYELIRWMTPRSTTISSIVLEWYAFSLTSATLSSLSIFSSDPILVYNSTLLASISLDLIFTNQEQILLYWRNDRRYFFRLVVSLL